jgi:sugar lactone lactonase YvrE
MTVAQILILLVRYGLVVLFFPASALDKILNCKGGVAQAGQVPRLADVLPPAAPLLCLFKGTLHGEGPVWQPARNRLLWSDVPNRRLLAWHPDGFAVDPRGWVWTTAADGIHILAPDRTRLGHMPAPTVCSNGTFGGEGMRRLFIAATNLLLAIDLAG